jgi:hypothetical protein
VITPFVPATPNQVEAGSSALFASFAFGEDACSHRPMAGQTTTHPKRLTEPWLQQVIGSEKAPCSHRPVGGTQDPYGSQSRGYSKRSARRRRPVATALWAVPKTHGAQRRGYSKRSASEKGAL